MVLLVIMILLLGGFAFYAAATTIEVSSLNGRVSSLQNAGFNLCQSIHSQVPPIAALVMNVSQTLRMQIQSDESLIATLNSTKPAGYAGMIAELSGNVAQDSELLASIDSLFPLTTGPGPIPSTDYCAQFNEK